MTKKLLSIFILAGLITSSVMSMQDLPTRPSKRTRIMSATESATPPRTPDGAGTAHPNFQSPFYNPATQENPSNFCKLITAAFNEDNLDEVKRLFIHFLKPIPYTVNMDRDPRYEHFYIALFTSLFSCLYGKNPNSIKDRMIHHPDSNLVATSIETDTYVYILQYNIGPRSMAPVFTYEINHDDVSEKSIRIISFKHTPDGTGHFKFEIFEIENDGQTTCQVTPHTINYNENNFYKQMLTCFTEHQIKLDIFLSKIYISIPVDLHIAREKFYQSIFYYLVKFFGNSNLNAELVAQRGRADVMIQTNSINIIEFKFNEGRLRDKTLGMRTFEAITQVKRKGYFDKFSGIRSQKWIFGVSINLDQKRSQLSVTVGSEEYIERPVSPFGFRAKKVRKELFAQEGKGEGEGSGDYE